MDMDMSPEVAEWFADLPLSDPRCDNTSCIAFNDAYMTSQANTPWAGQFDYGYYTAWFYSIIIFVAAIIFGLHQVQNRRKQTSIQSKPGLCDRATALFRSFTYRRIPGKLAEYLTWPSYGVLALLIFSFVSVVILSFAEHPYYRQKRGYGSPPLATRTGLMAFALIPLEVALAGKVNLVTCLTGLGHEKLNVFHRWVGWMILFTSILHTVPFLWQPYHEGGAAGLRETFYAAGAYEFTGVPPLGMLAGLVLLSLPPVRRMMYEVFVQLHILLAIVFLGLCFWHAGQTLDSWTYLWITLAFWCFSLLGRWFGKMSLFQIHGNWLSESPVALTKLSENMTRLEVTVPGKWRWEPGQHAFLRFLTLRPLDNHPFTIANTPREGPNNSTIMTFFIQGQKGLTARIGSLAESKAKTQVSVEGPYGTIVRPGIEKRYDNVLLVAGGGGISAMLPWLEHLSKISVDNSTVKSLTLIWAVRQKQNISWVEDELRSLRDLSKGVARFDIWVTDESATEVSIGDHTEKSVEANHASKEDGESTSGRSSILSEAHFTGRPNLKELIPSMISGGRNIVLGCGPESLKVDLSNAVAAAQRKVIKGEAAEIRLHTETFGW